MSAPGMAALEAMGGRLVRRFGTRDPEMLCERMGIHVYEEDLGRLKGMYRVILRRRCIFVNRRLEPDMRRMVLAHEIGHDKLHRAYATGAELGDLMLFDMSSRREYEANLLAAGILISDEEVLEGIRCGINDAPTLARALRVDVNLLSLKADAMRERGYPLRELSHDSTFLRG